LYAARTQQADRIREALPAIRDLFQQDKRDEAVNRMRELGIPPEHIRCPCPHLQQPRQPAIATPAPRLQPVCHPGTERPYAARPAALAALWQSAAAGVPGNARGALMIGFRCHGLPLGCVTEPAIKAPKGKRQRAGESRKLQFAADYPERGNQLEFDFMLGLDSGGCPHPLHSEFEIQMPDENEGRAAAIASPPAPVPNQPNFEPAPRIPPDWFKKGYPPASGPKDHKPGAGQRARSRDPEREHEPFGRAPERSHVVTYRAFGRNQ